MSLLQADCISQIARVLCGKTPSVWSISHGQARKDSIFFGRVQLRLAGYNTVLRFWFWLKSHWNFRPATRVPPATFQQTCHASTQYNGIAASTVSLSHYRCDRVNTRADELLWTTLATWKSIWTPPAQKYILRWWLFSACSTLQKPDIVPESLPNRTN